MANSFPCIIPTIADDYNRTKNYFATFFKYLPISEIILVGPESLRDSVLSDMDDKLFGDRKISYIPETQLVPFDAIKAIYNELCQKTSLPNPSSVNWYYQQFLKLAYARQCDAEYYLLWDSDTLPLQPISMFSEDERPYFDVKPECNTTYFTTIERLFHFTKIIEKSFISEHMIIKRDLMLEMLDEIEKLSYPGESFYEKILYAIGPDNLVRGFSEFETFGTWVGMRHSSAYKLRPWKSFRNLSFFVNINDLTEEDVDWLSKDYYAITFEKYQETEPALTELFRNPRYREKLSSQQFFLSVLESGALGEYSNGTIKQDGIVAPV